MHGQFGQEVELADEQADPAKLVLLREEIRCLERLAHELTADQRLVLACQVGLGMGRAEFCGLFGWTHEKYRKVGQRARARLRRLTETGREVPFCAGGSE